MKIREWGTVLRLHLCGAWGILRDASFTSVGIFIPNWYTRNSEVYHRLVHASPSTHDNVHVAYCFHRHYAGFPQREPDYFLRATRSTRYMGKPVYKPSSKKDRELTWDRSTPIKVITLQQGTRRWKWPIPLGLRWVVFPKPKITTGIVSNMYL